MQEERRYKVYMHVNKLNNKKYIGITSKDNVEDRWKKGNGYRRQIKFYRAIKKYGWDNFEHKVLFDRCSKLEAENIEVELIDYFNANNNKFGYNVSNGGNSIGKFTIETRNKISIANKGRVCSEEAKNKNRLAHLGKLHNEESKNKISNTMKNKKINIGKSNPMYGVTPVNAKKIICLNNNIVYNSITEASRILNLDFRLVSAVCNGKRHTTGGYTFKFYEDNCYGI